MKPIHHLLIVAAILVISACSPHPVSGVWKATEKNSYGISKLIVSFDGKAEFTTTNPDSATWRCFWAATEKRQAKLDCTPSTDPDQEKRFILTVNERGHAELSHQSKLITVLTLQNENPVVTQE